MTYNGWVMIAVSVGAFFGCLLFGHTTAATKDNACHYQCSNVRLGAEVTRKFTVLITYATCIWLLEFSLGS